MLAAVLNLIPLPFALGYAYLGRWGRFIGAILLRVIAVGVGFVIFVLTTIGCVSGGGCTPGEGLGLPLLILGVILTLSAMDAYFVARRDNARAMEGAGRAGAAHSGGRPDEERERQGS